MSTINTKSIREQVADILRLQIISGKLKPGDRISERDVSRQLDVSTTPVKEAFRVLETSGLLVTLPRKGTLVSEFARQSLAQVSILRSAMEGAGTNLSTINMSDGDIAELEDLLGQADELVDKTDTDTIEQIYKDFHSMISNHCGNQYLVQLIETQRAYIQGFRHEALMDMEARKLSHSEHRAILEAIKNRDNELAEILMRDHIRRSAKYALNNLEKTT